MGKYINKFISIIVSICLIVTNILSASYGKNFLATPGINSTWIPVYTHMGGATIAYKLLNYLLDADEINEDINIMITYLCNFDCSICLSAKMRKMREQKHAEKKALYSLFDQLYGFKKVHLVGAGEPLFYGMNKISYENVDQDFIDILNYAAARIGEVRVVTNASLVPDTYQEAKEFFLQFPHANIVWIVSVDAFHEEKMFQRTGKSLAKIVEIMEQLAEEGMIKTGYNIRVEDQAETHSVLKHFNLLKKHKTDSKNVFINTIIEQGNASKATNLHTHSMIGADTVTHAYVPGKLFPFIDVEGIFVTSDHVAYMTPDERSDPFYAKSIIGDTGKHSLPYLLLNKLLLDNFSDSLRFRGLFCRAQYKKITWTIIHASYLYLIGNIQEAISLMDSLDWNNTDTQYTISHVMPILVSSPFGKELLPFITCFIKGKHTLLALQVIDGYTSFKAAQNHSKRYRLEKIGFYILHLFHLGTNMLLLGYVSFNAFIISLLIQVSWTLFSLIYALRVPGLISKVWYKIILNMYWLYKTKTLNRNESKKTLIILSEHKRRIVVNGQLDRMLWESQ